ncbi:uncharacterized protein DEA37_0000065, partial [Paragonimus westermani]
RYLFFCFTADRATSIALLQSQLEITRLIVQAVDSVVSNATALPPTAWDSLLQFCLNVCHAVLAMPLPVPAQRMRPVVQTQVTHASSGALHTQSTTVTNLAYDLAGVSVSGHIETQTDPARIAETIADCVVDLLMRTWLMACAHCFPRPQMWAALTECVKVWRHQSVLVAHWSRVLVAVTSQLVNLLYGPVRKVSSVDVPSPPSLPAVDRMGYALLPREMSPECIKETWFRFLYLLGNPVDFCDPRILVTPVFEKCKKTSAADRVAMAPICLPYIYHQALRGLSIVVDGFLGIQPSLVVGVEASLSVPPELYRPTNSFSPILHGASKVAASDFDTESRRSVVASASTPTNQGPRTSTTNVITEKGSRKLKLPSVVTSASLLASSGNASIRHPHSGIPAESIGAASVGSSQHISGTTVSGQLSVLPFTGNHPNNIRPQQNGASNSSFYWSAATSGGFSQSPNFVHLQTLAHQWLSPEPNHGVSSLRPEVNTLMQLFGPWLFEAAMTGVDKDFDLALISTRTEKFPSYMNFQAGRAEALAALCRIVLYARRGQMSQEHLVRFYLCLHYGLDTEAGRNDYVLSTVLFFAVDLLREDLPGINILLPRVFAACQLVFRDENITRPEYLTMDSLRRAAIHQLMAMVCIPTQFEGATLRCLVPISSNAKDPVTLSTLKNQLAYFLCEILEREKDPVNFQMLLSTSLALLEDMAADEQTTPLRHLTVRSGDDRLIHKRLHTASSLFNTLVPSLCSLLVRDWSSESTAQYLLEVLCAIASVRVSPPDPMIYRETVRQICEFITNQCQRQSKYHKRQLHSVIVAAFSCLSVWIVEHAQFLLVDSDCLQTIMGTIELGICGLKSKPGPPKLPIPKNEKTPTPASKRVQDAAESCLAVLMSLAGTFPGPAGVATTSSLITEDQLVYLLAPPEAIQDMQVLQTLRSCFHYYWSEPGVLLGILELDECYEFLHSKGFKKGFSETWKLPEAILIIRGAFGRHLWAVRMRQLPKHGPDAAKEAEPSQPTSPLRPEPWGCFLERLISTVGRNETAEALTFPASIKDIPLVDADYTLSSLEQVGGAAGSRSREQINSLKAVIATQSNRVKEVARQCLKQRLATAYPDPSTELKPPDVKCIGQEYAPLLLFYYASVPPTIPCRVKTSFQVARLLLMHLGYLSVNTFHMMEPDLLSGTNGDRTVTETATITTQSAIPVASAPSNTLSTASVLSDREPLFQPMPSFFHLDSKNPELYKMLNALDRLPTRTGDTLLVFYVAAGQNKSEDILGNMKSWSELPSEFHAFMQGLGAFVEISRHPGWTGSLETSYCAVDNHIGMCADATRSMFASKVPNSTPDGHQFILYSADAISEFACICPSDFPPSSTIADESRCGVTQKRPSTDYTAGSQRSLGPQPTTVSGAGEIGADPTGGRVAVVWLERWEDGPITSGPDGPGWATHHMTYQLFHCPVTIYVHPLSSKLYRIGVLRAPGRVYEAGPLQNGLVLSARCLTSFVRQTVANVARRRRLASDQFQPPHVRRRYRISELDQLYRQRQASRNSSKSTLAFRNVPEVIVELFSAAA